MYQWWWTSSGLVIDEPSFCPSVWYHIPCGCPRPVCCCDKHSIGHRMTEWITFFFLFSTASLCIQTRTATTAHPLLLRSDVFAINPNCSLSVLYSLLLKNQDLPDHLSYFTYWKSAQGGFQNPLNFLVSAFFLFKSNNGIAWQTVCISCTCTESGLK